MTAPSPLASMPVREEHLSESSQTSILRDTGALVFPGRSDRLRKRYPLDLLMNYKVLRRGRVESQGAGHTLNIGTDGALVETAGLPTIVAGVEIVLTIDWPVLLGGKCALKLLMRGRVVWRVRRCIAVRADHYEFRTARARPLSVESTDAHRPAVPMCNQGSA